MTRMRDLAVLLGVLTTIAGCGGGSTTPVKVTPEVIESQKKMQDEADDGERNLHAPPSKKKK